MAKPNLNIDSDLLAGMEAKIELKWVRAAQQDRSRRTMNRILDATETLLLKRGFDHVGVAEIARQACVSVGAIYARFQHKNGLLQVLHQRFSEEAMVTTEAALGPNRWEGATTAEIIGALVGFLVRIHSERAGLLRAFSLYGRNDPHFQARNRRMTENFLERLQTLLRTRHGEIGHPDPELAISFGLALVSGVLKNTFILGEGVPEPGTLSLEALETELLRAYRDYLHLAPAANEGRQ
jgi:AcrR family transcriptional regulator